MSHTRLLTFFMFVILEKTKPKQSQKALTPNCEFQPHDFTANTLFTMHAKKM